MKFEAIKHEACKEIFEPTEYEWTNQLDNTTEAEKAVRNWTDEQKLKEYWLNYFAESYQALKWSDEH